MKFWEVTWGKLAPDDVVRAPDGSVWKIGSAIIFDGRGEWELSSPEGHVLWTEQSEDTPVQAARAHHSRTPTPPSAKQAESLLGDALGARKL